MLWISHSGGFYRPRGFHVASMWLQSQSQLCPLTSSSSLPIPVKSRSQLYVFWPQLKAFLEFLCDSFHLYSLCRPCTWFYLEPAQVCDSRSHAHIYHIGFIHSQRSHPGNTPLSPSFIKWETACSQEVHRTDEVSALSPRGRTAWFPNVQLHTESRMLL